MKRYPATILATCVVPWNEKYEFDEAQFRNQVRTLRNNLTKHLYIFGTAGEGYAVTEKQFDRISAVFREETKHADTATMVGVISLSLPTIIERIERSRDLGFRNFQISLPAWGALTDAEVAVFFKETCGRFPDCKFLHYNLMRTKKVLNGDDYARLSAAHPNLVAVKTGSDDKEFLTGLLTKAPELQIFMGEFGYVMLRDTYECGLLISLAATNLRMAQEFFNARGNKLQAMDKDQHHIMKVVLESVGSAAHMDGAFDKMLIKLHQADFPLRLLPPYGFATEAMFNKFKQGLPELWRPEQNKDRKAHG